MTKYLVGHTEWCVTKRTKETRAIVNTAEIVHAVRHSRWPSWSYFDALVSFSGMLCVGRVLL